MIRLVRRFARLEAAPGLLLMASALLAMVAANAPGLAPLYQAFLEVPVQLRIGPLALDKNFLLVINDGLMAVFFLLVGLEIKRELIEGELSSPAKWFLPAVGAVGGVALPAAIYAVINRTSPETLGGWAIPAATDIAFSLGILALLGKKVPLSLKVFLTTVAVIDDLAAISIIAVFYTANLSLLALGVAAAGAVVLFVLNRRGVTALGGYFLVGSLMWVALIKSGVHATLAGVVLAFAIPLRATAAGVERTPLRDLEHGLHSWVTFFILPLFAFANAGVALAGISLDTFLGPVSLGIALGLLVGKPIGIFATTGLLVLSGRARWPVGTDWKGVLGVSCLAGVGFTMSLFIGTLAFDEQGLHHEVATRLGVFAGSIGSALLGLGILWWALPRSTRDGTTTEAAAVVPKQRLTSS